MRKDLILLLSLILFFSACAPSQNAIQTAIAKTEAARPTATSIPPTNTPLPTATPTLLPTFTPVPKTALHKLLVTINDFATFSEYYKPNPLLNDKIAAPVGTVLDSCEESFEFGNLSFIGDVTIGLYRYEDELKAQYANHFLKDSAGDTNISITSTELKLPDDIWGKVDISGDVSVGATYKDVVINVEIVKTTGLEAPGMAYEAVILLKSQITHLEDGGY